MSIVSSIPPRVQLLCLVHHDGYIEFYCDNPRATVKTLIVPHATSQAGEILADEWLQQVIPHYLKPIYGQDCLIGTAMVRDVTPDDIADTHRAINAVRFLQEVSELNKEFHRVG